MLDAASSSDEIRIVKKALNIDMDESLREDLEEKGEQMFEDSKMQDNWINYKVLKELKYDIYKAISQNWETVFSDEFFDEDSFSLEQSYSNKNQLVVNFKPRKEAYFKWEYDFEQFKAGLKTIPNLKLKSIHKKSVSVRFDTARFIQVDQIVFQYIGQITDSIREDSKMQDNEIIEYKGIKIGVLHTSVGKLYEVRYNKNRADWPEYYKLENAKKYIDILLTKGEQAANASWETAEGENRSYQPDILLDDILSWFEDHEQAKEDLIIYLKNNKYTDEDIKDLFGVVEESLNESSKEIDEGEDWYRTFSVEDLIPLTHGDEDAAEIILKWYDDEGAYEDFDDKEDYISFIEDDISDMLDAATSSDEVEIVKKALNIDMDESLNESSKSNYNIEYYLNTATAERRPSTAEDVEEDYIYDTIQASNDLEALEEAFFIQTGEDYYEEIFDDYGAEDTVEGLKDYFDGIDIGDGSTIICKITQGSRVVYNGGLNKQYFLGEVDEDNEDEVDLEPEDLYPLLEKRGIKRKDIKKAADIIYVVYYELNFETDFVEDYTIKKDLIDFIDSDLDERVESLEGYEPFMADFNEKDIRWLRKIFNIHSDDEYSKEIDEGEAVFTKKNGTPGYLVKDGGKIKFLRNYTEDQVKKLGFTVKN